MYISGPRTGPQTGPLTLGPDQDQTTFNFLLYKQTKNWIVNFWPSNGSVTLSLRSRWKLFGVSVFLTIDYLLCKFHIPTMRKGCVKNNNNNNNSKNKGFTQCISQSTSLMYKYSLSEFRTMFCCFDGCSSYDCFKRVQSLKKIVWTLKFIMCGPQVHSWRAHIVFAHFLKNGHQGALGDVIGTKNWQEFFIH